jgi:dienelactone hydrolase
MEAIMRYFFTVFILFLAFVSAAEAKLRTETVEYADSGKVLEGYLAYDDAFEGRRPGVLVVHEWWGINDYIKKRTEMLAGLGYVAFAADIYGKGIRTADPDVAGRLAGIYRADRSLLRRRTAKGLEVLTANALTDATRVAAIGYCFGGTAVLELARSGAPLSGVVSFHGNLDTPSPETSLIKAKVLVLTGALDPYVTPERVREFEDEMKKAGADWFMVSYGGAVHSFTNTASGADPSKGIAYNETADRRSWRAMKDFFSEIFK